METAPGVQICKGTEQQVLSLLAVCQPRAKCPAHSIESCSIGEVWALVITPISQMRKPRLREVKSPVPVQAKVQRPQPGFWPCLLPRCS